MYNEKPIAILFLIGTYSMLYVFTYAHVNVNGQLNVLHKVLHTCMTCMHDIINFYYMSHMYNTW